MKMPIPIIECLLELANRGADKEFIRISTAEIGRRIARSQQTASRLLASMEEKGLLERRKAGRDQLVRVTPEGISELRKLHRALSRIFEGLVIEGKVFTGIGEGAYYTSQEGYRRQFREKLGFDPFPGTLNLRVPAPSVEELASRPGLKIEGFRSGSRSFGGGRCYPVRVGSGTQGAVFLPDRTHYPSDVLEVISPHNLRQRLSLTDGDLVRLVLYGL